jgi:hypothetical protein
MRQWRFQGLALVRSGSGPPELWSGPVVRKNLVRPRSAETFSV